MVLVIGFRLVSGRTFSRRRSLIALMDINGYHQLTTHDLLDLRPRTHNVEVNCPEVGEASTVVSGNKDMIHHIFNGLVMRT